MQVSLASRHRDRSDKHYEADFADRWTQWHDEHERQRARPHGFLAITGLHWLDEILRRFEDVPGAWSTTLDGVDVVLGENEELNIEDVRVIEHYHFANVDEQGTTAQFGDAIVEVALRDGHFMIRPRDPNNEVRVRYAGTPTFEASLDWVTHGRLVPFAEPRSVSVGASVEGLSQVYMSPGEVQFQLVGQEFCLVAFSDDAPAELFFVFRDATAGDTTYAKCRFLRADAPDSDARVILDFNRATNPPCAYTDFATCPLRPEGNDLPVRIEAGEKMPLMSH